MSAMTLSGRESPSAPTATTKRIDVEANLLEDWLEDRRDLKRSLQIRAFAALAAIGFGMYGVTMLLGLKADVAVHAKPLEQRLKAIDTQLAQLAPANGGAASQATLQALFGAAKKNSDAYTGQVISLLNTTSPSMALQTLKADILGGELKMTGSADAENYYTADQFIQRNNDPAKGLNAVLVSTSRSDLLATDGVSFQFVKKVKVGQ